MPKKILYSEPPSYFPKSVKDKYFKEEKKTSSAPKPKAKPKATAKKKTK